MSILYASLWLLFIELLAWAILPVTARAVGGSMERALSLSRPLGLLVVGYFCWLLPAVGLVPVGAGTVLGSIGLVMMLAMGLGLPWSRLLESLAIERRGVVTTTKLYIGTVAVFLVCRAFQPEIHWGEKPMDFSFFNHFVRASELPVQDPWAAGQAMHYYYLGTYLFSIPLKVLPIPPGVAYNLAVATVPALMISSAYAALRVLTMKRWAAIAGCLAGIVLSNGEALRQLIFTERELNFDLFWATSRVLAHTMANEYPLWSTLFGDLHAHFVGMAYLTLAVALLLCLYDRRLSRTSDIVLHRMVLAVVWGCLLAINTWDFLTFGVIAAVVFLSRPLEPASGEGLRGDPWVRFFQCRLYDPALTGTAAVVVMLPFLPVLNTGSAAGYGWERHAFNEASQIVRHLGHFLVPIWVMGAAVALQRFLRRYRPMRRARRRLGGSAAAVALAVAPLLACSLSPAKTKPWDVMALVSLLALAGCLTYGLGRRRGARAAGALIVATAALIGIAELGWLLDRMNSLFKVYCAIWLVAALGAGATLPHLLKLVRAKAAWVINRPRPGLPPLPNLSRALSLASVLILAAAAIASSALNIGVMTTFRRVSGPRPTLDGTAYLETTRPADRALYDWIWKNIDGVPVILEAHGDAYGQFTRVAMFTGLPTVLGWEHHVKQRGTPPDEVERRKHDIRQIYTARTPGEIRPLLDRYRISWIVVGDLERKRYAGDGLAKFEKASTDFKEVFRNETHRLYAVLDPAP